MWPPPLLTRAIEGAGLRLSFWGEGLFSLILALLAVLLIRDSPEELGLQPYSTGESPVQGKTIPVRQKDFTPVLWWAAVAAAFFTGGPCGPGFSHLTVLYTAEGYDSGTVALMISCFGVVLMLSKVLYGSISDALGSRTANFFTFGTGIAGFALCCLAPLGSMPLNWVGLVCTALGMPLSSVSLSVWAGELSGGGDYDRLVKWLSTSYMVGALVTGPVPGMLADRFGSYVPAYALFAGCLVCSMILIQGVYVKLGVGKKAPRP